MVNVSRPFGALTPLVPLLNLPPGERMARTCPACATWRSPTCRGRPRVSQFDDILSGAHNDECYMNILYIYIYINPSTRQDCVYLLICILTTYISILMITDIHRPSFQPIFPNKFIKTQLHQPAEFRRIAPGCATSLGRNEYSARVQESSN